MPQATRASKRKRLKDAMPVVGAVGVSLSLAGTAAAVGVVGTDADVKPQKATPEILINDEEISDVTLATFHVFDKEASRARELAAGGRRGRALGGGCGGCGCGHGSTAG